MGQQPNIQPDAGQRPRSALEPSPARRWTPNMRPGMINSPDQVPHGGAFGVPGPDAGWAHRVMNHVEMPSNDPDLRAVVAALVMARAGLLGRGPIMEDVEVALTLCGYFDGAPPGLEVRRQRWLDAVPHEPKAGTLAVSEVDRELLVNPPQKVRYALTR